jgi:hypothetical protein
LAARAAAELDQIATVTTVLARRLVVVPWLAEEPRGADQLRQIVQPVVAVQPADSINSRGIE